MSEYVWVFYATVCGAFFDAIAFDTKEEAEIELDKWRKVCRDYGKGKPNSKWIDIVNEGKVFRAVRKELQHDA